MKIFKAGIVILFFISCGVLRSQTLEDEAVGWLQNYIQIDTINPPGNEYRAVDFLAEIFEAEGIEYQTAESARGEEIYGHVSKVGMSLVSFYCNTPTSSLLMKNFGLFPCFREQFEMGLFLAEGHAI